MRKLWSYWRSSSASNAQLWKGTTLLVIEKVPVVSCPHCGASYLTAKTLHEIARIKLHRRSMTKRRSVAVAEFVSTQETG